MPDATKLVTLQQRMVRFSGIMAQSPASRKVMRELWERRDSRMHRLRDDLQKEARHWISSNNPETPNVEGAIDISILLFYGDGLSAEDIAGLATEPVRAPN